MDNLQFTKSERNLLFILTILLAIFIYVNLIRSDLINTNECLKIQIVEIDGKVEELNLLKDNISELKAKESNSDVESAKREIHNSFGSVYNFITSSEESNRVQNYSISKPYDSTLYEIPVSRIDSGFTLEGKLEDLLSFLEKLNEQKYLIQDSLDLVRIDKNNFRLQMNISEITLTQLPYSGIEYSGSTHIEGMEGSSLLESLYSSSNNKSIYEEENTNQVYNKSTVASISSSDEVQKNNVVESSTLKANETAGVVNYETYFGSLDENNNKVINSGSLSKYNNDYYVNLLLDSKCFDENESVIKKDSNLIGSIYLDNYTGETTIEIKESISLDKLSLKIERPNDAYTLQFRAPENSKIDLELLSRDGNLINVEGVVSKDGWNELNFELPRDENLYPISLNNISVSGEGEDLNGAVKNFATLNKK